MANFAAAEPERLGPHHQAQAEEIQYRPT